ncbi:MAG: 1-acyl-sn-glycerol-3-phosphate acyltransferase [Planctomycetaceae bacterium]|nr:1-acyl-sn-glycerol-3-phosphate acyltransferase [Planctomycetaceae bacterium]
MAVEQTTDSDNPSADGAAVAEPAAAAGLSTLDRRSPEAAVAGTPPKRNLLWRVFHVFIYALMRSWIRAGVAGKEHIDNTQGGLFLVNHQSYLDPLLAAVFLNRPVSYLARDNLFRVPVIGWILARTHVIPISREAFRGGSIRTALERLEEGFLVGIFPEGTRSCGDQVGTFRPGFLSLVRRCSVPVYPVAIAGADRIMPRGAWWIRPRRVEIVYGPPLTAEELNQLRHGTDDRQLAELARRRVAECHQAALRRLNGGAENR